MLYTIHVVDFYLPMLYTIHVVDFYLPIFVVDFYLPIFPMQCIFTLLNQWWPLLRRICKSNEATDDLLLTKRWCLLTWCVATNLTWIFATQQMIQSPLNMKFYMSCSGSECWLHCVMNHRTQSWYTIWWHCIYASCVKPSDMVIMLYNNCRRTVRVLVIFRG